MKYKPNNSGEVVTKSDYSKRIIFKLEDFKNAGYLLQTVTIPPNTKQRTHYHTQQTEVFYILKGKCLMYFNDIEYQVKSGDAFICEPNDKHYLWNKSNKEFKLVVFKINYPEEDDTVWEEK